MATLRAGISEISPSCQDWGLYFSQAERFDAVCLQLHLQGKTSSSYTPLQVASFPTENCSIPPFPNSAPPWALFQPPPRLLLRPALCLQAQVLALGSRLRGRKADLTRTPTPRGLQVPFLLVLPQAQSLGKGLRRSLCLESPQVPGTGSPVSTLRQAPFYRRETWGRK